MADRVQWEYTAMAAGAELVPALNAAGREGWEACTAIQHVEHGTVIILKRPAKLIVTDLSSAPAGMGAIG